jgi:hypothetical protein
MIKSPSSAPSTPLTKADKLASIFPSPKKPTKPLPGLELLGLQCITERRGVTVERNRDLKIGLEIPLRIDVSSPIAIPPGEITMARLSLRWKEEFVEVRLESALEASKLEAKQEKKGGLGVFFHCTALDLDSPPRLPEKVPTTFKDVPACRIYLEPHVTAIGGPQKQNSPLVSLFSTTPRSPTTRTTAGEIVYTTYEEISGAPGIDVFFTSPHKSGKQGFYWFIIEDSSWRLVLQEVTADSTWGRENCSRFDKNFSHKAERFIGEKLRKPAYHPTMGRKRVSSNTEPEKKVRSYVANIYGAIHEEPLISVDMVTGQMWIVEGIQIEMVDVVVAILCAAVNLEKGMNAVVGGGKRRDSWVKEMQGALERIDGSGCI